MPERNPSVPPPFDHGVFLLHYNKGREAFQEARLAEARRELESAQKMRPDDADVLNLLGLVYFKTNAFPEAEVIYRRLTRENSDVFILHSNLGLILFKQGKLDEAERYLRRAVELRPNYAKSQLYLGLLYRERRNYPAALEHLKVAGADKVMREVEAEVRSQQPQPATTPSIESVRLPITAKPSAPLDTVRVPAYSPPMTPSVPLPRGLPSESGQEPAAHPNERSSSLAASTAARKLQDAVDEPQAADQKRIDLGGRRIEGASRTFALHENGFLEINFAESVHVKRGTVSSYSGNLKFVSESGLIGTTAQTLVRATGQGKLFVFERGRKTFLLDLNEEFIYVEGGNLLALEDSLAYRVEPIYDSGYQKKIDTVKIFGRGSLAISTSIEPLTLRVTRDYPLSISSDALVAWTGDLIPTVMDDEGLASVMIAAEDNAFKIRFEGDGVVVSEH